MPSYSILTPIAMSEISEGRRKTLLKEYEIGEQLRDCYFRNSWILTSIVLPISFGIIGLSYTEQVLNLEYFALFPLMLASLTLFAFWYFYIVRYADWLATIYQRLQTIEKLLGMSLHTNIKKVDEKTRFYKLGGLRTLNNATGGMLAFIWLVRIVYAMLA